MLGPGDTAPAFTLLDSDGRERSLESLLSPQGLVLFFYPGDFTPICTREVCMVQDLYAGLEAAGLPIAGISPDDPATHERFRQRHSLIYTLLSDPEKSAICSYGVAGPLGFGVRRATFLIGADGRIEDALTADFRVEAHRRFLAGIAKRIAGAPSGGDL